MEAYKQTTQYSTAAAGLLAILHHFNKVSLMEDLELELWHRSVLLPTRASSIFGLAILAKEFGLQPTVYVETIDYDYPDYRFKRYTKADIAVAQRMHENYLRQAQEKNIELKLANIHFDQVLDFLRTNHVLLIRLNEGVFRNIASTSKYVVLYGKDNGQYLLLDPLLDEPLKRISRDELQESFETLIEKKKRNHRMLVFKDS